MRILFLINVFLVLGNVLLAQVTTELGPANYSVINLGHNPKGDYSKSVIILHEIYDTEQVDMNYAIGQIHALRGTKTAYNRLNVVNVNSSSSYKNIRASYNSVGENKWELVTVELNKKKHLALQVPYLPAYHNHSFQFVGHYKSTGEQMKLITYKRNRPDRAEEIYNAEINRTITKYKPNLNERFCVNELTIDGKLNIGTNATNDYQLAVDGTIGTKELKVRSQIGADFVFEDDYSLMPIEELEEFVKSNKHLPEVAPAKKMEEDGVRQSEMNQKLLQKVEELTLYLIDQNKQLKNQNEKIEALQKEIESMKKATKK